MPSSRDPRIVKIIRGEHEVSPHFTSLKRDDLRVSQHFLTQKAVPQHKAQENQHSISMNLISEELQRAPAPEKQKKDRPKTNYTSFFKKLFEKEEKTEYVKPTPRKKSSGSITRSQVFAFILFALAIVTPFKVVTTYERLREARADVEHLTSQTSSSGNFDSVGLQIADALKTFHSANESLDQISGAEEFILRNTPVLGEQYGTARRLVGAGEHVSMAAASYIHLFKTLQDKPDAPLIERLTLFFDGNRAVVRDLTAAAELVRPIDPSILENPEQQKVVTDARAAILALHNDAEYLASAGPIILSALGDTAPRRYLIVFQNSNELRATGGFIGSFALLDIEKGEIKNLNVPAGGSYDLQGTLKKQVYSPLPLHIINTRWEFQDANWFPDFPTSAQKLMWFLEKSQGPSVDGVIAINASVLPQLLSVVGPVAIENGKELTAETALATVRTEINTANSNAETKSKPKEIISEAAPILMETIKNSESSHLLPLVNVLMKSLESRDIQLYTRDADIQKQIAEFGWDGSLRANENGDFLSVITSNIGGQKTDSLITQSIDHQAKIADDGTVTVTVRVARQQKLSDKDFEGAPNISYVRFYVPQGSTLLSADGFNSPSESMFEAPEQWQTEDSDLKNLEREIGFHSKSGTRITEEFNHTAFGNWMITTPGGSTEAIISYTLPFKVTPRIPTGFGKIAQTFYKATPAASYSIYLQRQSGSSPTTVTSRVILPETWKLGWITDNRAQVAENGALLKTQLTNDIYYGLTAHVYAKNTNTSTSTQKEN